MKNVKQVSNPFYSYNSGKTGFPFYSYNSGKTGFKPVLQL